MMKRKTLNALGLILAALLLAGCADESPEKRIASAKEYLQKNDTKSAVIEIKNALQKNPDSGEARFLLGTTLLQDGNPVAAEVELRKALALKYSDELVIPELARAMLLLGQAKQVVDEFSSSRFDKPAANANLQTTLAAAYGALGKLDQGQAALNAALVADPKYAPALLVSARQKAAARDFDAALAVVDDVISREPNNPDAWKLKGDILVFAKNKPDDALVAYRKALEANAKYFPAHVSVLTVLMQQGDVAEASKQLEQLKKFAAHNPQTKYFEAQLAFQKKDFKVARELSQQLLQQTPNNPRVLQMAGAIELQMGAVAQAEIYLSRATQAAPELALARRLLIVAYLRSGQSAKALTALNAATGKDGLDPSMYPLAGEVYLQNGDAKKAEEYFAKALKLDPDNARKRTALAVTHLAGGQTAAALDELQNIAASDASATADLALISAHLRRKEFDKALAAVDRLEAKQPDKPLAPNLRGRIQLAQKNNVAARKSFEQALTIDPNFFAAAASLAALDVADKKPDDARKRFENLLAKNPKDGRALLALAELAALQGAGKDEVAGLLTKAVDANPTNATPRLLLIELYLRTNQTKQAATAAQSAVAALPNSPELLDALGRTQQALGELNQAIVTFGKLAALQPLSPQPHMRLAGAQVANKNKAAAQQSLHKALEIKPDFLDAQRALIVLALEAQAYQEAMKIVRTVQEQRPKAPVGYLLEGDIAMAQKRLELAAVAYRAGLRHAPSAEAAVKLHTSLLMSNKHSEAETLERTWLKEQPRDDAFVAYLGGLAISRKDFAAAERYYLLVLQIQPNSAIALNNLAWVTGQLHKDGAIGYAERATKLAPNQPPFMDTLAMLLAQKGDYAGAIELLNNALKIQPLNAAIRLNLARVYVQAGEKVRAKTELDTLAKLGEKFPAQPEVSAMLKSL
jgi:putative PEP-CTERM system TPR-repeat lipoprotein